PVSKSFTGTVDAPTPPDVTVVVGDKGDDPVGVSGTGFLGSSDVTITVSGTPTGSVTANPDGSVNTETLLTNSGTPGVYNIELTGTAADGTPKTVTSTVLVDWTGKVI